MAQTIKLKRTATPSNVPTTAQLELGEIAVNTYDGNVYIKKNDGVDSIVKVNASPSDLNYFVNGEGTVSGTWLGTDPDITSYYDGLVIWYRITVNGAATTTLNINGLGAKTVYRYSTAKLTTHWPIGSVIPLVYSSVLNGGSFIGGYDWSDGTQSYDLRWSSAVVNGSSIIHGYQLLMEGADTKFYPVTVGGAANSTTNVVQTAPLRIGGQMLYYNSATDIAVNAVIGGNLLYESIESGEGEYWMNRTSSSSWTAIGLPLYIVGTVNANNELILDNSTTTAFLTNALPTTEDGKIYIHVGYSDNEDDLWRLSVTHPIFEFKAGAIRRYTPALIPSEVLDAVKTVDGSGSGLDADLLDGQQGSYYATAASVAAVAALDPVITLTGAVTGTGTMTNLGSVSIATTATSDPVITLTGAVTGTGTMTNLGNVSITTTNTADPVLTLTGDVTGTATFTNLGNATLTAVVADDSHNHIISNVDGLQTALDSKLNLTGGTVSGTLTLDNGGSSVTSLVMKGTTPTISFLDDDLNADDFYIHINSNRFYILANRTDAEVDLVGTGWETPYPMYLDSSNNTGYLFDQRMFSDSYHPNADTLTTARTINGVSFNGSANITVADGTKLPLAGGTATGTINAPTFNATSTVSGGFQGIDADTITAPSFTWTSDLDTGMWHAGTDAIGFTTGGTNRLTVSTTAVTSTLNVAAPTFSGSGASLTSLNGSNISSGTVAAARVATLNQNTTGSSGSCTGNSATASAFNGTRTVSLTGDVTGSTTTWTGSGALSIATTIAANSVALGTDTTGNYVAGVTAGSGMVVTGTAGEGWSPTVGLAALDLTLFPTSNYKKSVRVATTANITLSGVQTIDAVAVVAGNRVLVKNQTTASQNGIYVVAAGAWTRSTAADGSTEIDSAVVGVESGTVNGGLFFTNVFKSTDVLNTTAMPWYKVTTDLDQSTTNTGNKIVQRDASGNFSAGTITATAFSGSGASLSALNGSNITTGTVAAARVATLNQSTTGNAATATALQTARTINGVSFNGTANITVADGTKLPLAGGTATGTINAPTFNATSVTSGGFQGIDADTITAPSFTWTSDLDTGMWHAGVDQIGFTTAGVNRVTITSTGITAVGDVTAYSDMRLKENIKVIPNAVSKVQQLRGVTFTRNDAEDLEKRHTGVIAQEVEAVLPEAVSEDNAGIKNVAYGNMVGLLIEAIKELKAEVDDLKAQLVKKENTRGHL